MTKSIYSLKIILLILFTTIMGCTNTKITSKVVEPKYDKEVSNLYYAIYLSDDMEKIVPAFTDETQTHFQLNEMKFEVEEFGFFDNPESFSIDSLYANARKKGFNHVIMLSDKSTDKKVQSSPGAFVGGMYMGGGTTKMITHNLVGFLYDVEEGKEVWRAQFETKSGQFGNSKQTGESVALQLVKQLKSDGLLPPKFLVSDPNRY